MSTMMPSRKYMTGLSLIEMMIAMIIGLIMMLGVVQIFIASRSASQLSEGAARTQENARFALDYLQRDLRMAGHFGCVNDQAHVVKGNNSIGYHIAGVVPGSGVPLDFSVPIQGYEAGGTAPTNSLTIGATWQAALATPDSIQKLKPAPIAGSDILVLRFFHPDGVAINTLTSAASESKIGISTASAQRLAAGVSGGPSVFGVADCTRAEVFTGQLNGTTVTADATDLSQYAANNAVTMLYRAEAVVYYVASNGTEPALYRARAGSGGGYGDGEELVEGIESLQFLYGLDAEVNISRAAPPTGNIVEQRAGNNVSTATTAAAVAQWRRVGLVQVGLLARSPQQASAEAPKDANNYLGVLGVTIVPPATDDKRFRASYEVSVALRNRLFGN